MSEEDEKKSTPPVTVLPEIHITAEPPSEPKPVAVLAAAVVPVTVRKHIPAAVSKQVTNQKANANWLRDSRLKTLRDMHAKKK